MSNEPRPNEVVTHEYAREVCKTGRGKECCRYITMGSNGWSCEKLSTMKVIIDQRVHRMTAQGDNCSGKASR